MGWFSNRWAVLKISVGPRRFLLVPIFGAVVAGADWVVTKLSEAGLGYLIGVPSWAIGLYAATLLILWWVIEYCVKLRKQITGVRVALSKLRSEGVNIRNDGMSMFATQGEFDSWKQKTEDWNNRVIKEIRNINEADAEWFAVLDVVEPPRLPLECPSLEKTTGINWLVDHERHYQNHDFRLKRLGEMVQNLWREQ